MENLANTGRAAEPHLTAAEKEFLRDLATRAVRAAVLNVPPPDPRQLARKQELPLEPRLLLLDEPMTGMNQEEKEDMARFVLDIHERQGMTVLLIEHDMGLVMDVADRIVVLDFGSKIAEGTPEEIRRNEAVINAYLGKASVA